MRRALIATHDRSRKGLEAMENARNRANIETVRRNQRVVAIDFALRENAQRLLWENRFHHFEVGPAHTSQGGKKSVSKQPSAAIANGHQLSFRKLPLRLSSIGKRPLPAWSKRCDFGTPHSRAFLVKLTHVTRGAPPQVIQQHRIALVFPLFATCTENSVIYLFTQRSRLIGSFGGLFGSLENPEENAGTTRRHTHNGLERSSDTAHTTQRMKHE